MPNDKEAKVIIGGEVMLYSAKAPYVRSGQSLAGAIEYDEDNDRIRCHECGLWFKCLPLHLKTSHGINAAEYKKKHGLRKSAALVNEKTRSAMIKNGHSSYRKTTFAERRGSFSKSNTCRPEYTVEDQNRMGCCSEQTIEKLRRLAQQLGSVPSRTQLREARISVSTLAFHFGSVHKAFELAGIGSRRPFKWGKRALLEALKTFKNRHGRYPSFSDSRRGLLPSTQNYVRYFGSFRAAIEQCGLPQTRAQYQKRARRLLTR